MKYERPWLAATRWTARTVGAFLVPLIVAFAIADVPAGPLRGSTRENSLLIAIFAMVVGQFVAWKWERAAGLSILAGCLLFAVVNHGVPLQGVFGPCFLTGLLYLGCWWRGAWTTEPPTLPSASRPAGALARWTIGSMLVLSLVSFSLAVVGWLILIACFRQNFSGLEGLGVAICMFYLVICGMVVTSCGCVFALTGLITAAFARRRIDRRLAVLLALNAAAGPIPFLCVFVGEYCARNPPLVRAVRSGDVSWVQSVLSEHPIPAKPDHVGHQALCVAVEDRRIEIVDALATAYAKSDRDDCLAVSLDNALVIASRKSDADFVGCLVQAGADPNAPPRKCTTPAAVAAVRSGNGPVLKVLVDAGAKIEMPLDEAVGTANIPFIKLLLSHNADRQFQRDPAFGSHLLSTAAFRQSEDVTKILLDAGCDPNVKPGGYEWLPLQTAVCMSHNPGIVALLLDHGANPNDPQIRFNNDPKQPTLLECVEQNADRSHDRRIVELLKKHGAR